MEELRDGWIFSPSLTMRYYPVLNLRTQILTISRPAEPMIVVLSLLVEQNVIYIAEYLKNGSVTGKESKMV